MITAGSLRLSPTSITAKMSAGPRHCWLAAFLLASIYGVARSQLSRCVDQDEIGKVFGGIALLAASIEFGSSPLYKIIFQETFKVHRKSFHRFKERLPEKSIAD